MTLATARPAGTPAPLPNPGSAALPEGGDQGLLHRSRPVLHLDAREPTAPVSARAFLAAAERRAGSLKLERPVRSTPTVHGRTVREDGRLWLQYWMLYPDNRQDRGVFRTGRHDGDWELVQIVLSPDGRPAAATYAQHSWTVGCALRAPPDVWVAHGSHAAYPRPGDGDRPWPDPDDEAHGDGPRVRPRVVPFGAWASYPGRWGASGAGLVPGEQSSPRGPAFQRERFESPTRLHRGSRGCHARPPAHPWWLRTLAFGILLGAAAAMVRAITRHLRPSGTIGRPRRPSTGPASH